MHCGKSAVPRSALAREPHDASEGMALLRRGGGVEDAMEPSLCTGASVPVPGLDVSLPPLCAGGPLVALGTDYAGTGTGIGAGMGMGFGAGMGREQERPFRAFRGVVGGIGEVGRGTAGVGAIGKRKRVWVYWSREELARLLTGCAMAGVDLEKVAKVVGSRSAETCRKQLRSIAERVGLGVGKVSKETCVATVLRHHKLALPPPSMDAEWAASRRRDSTKLKVAKHKVAIQVVPHDDSVDGAPVRAKTQNPCVEVVLRASRSIWDVILHLHGKWGFPLQLLSPNGAVLSVAETVFAVEAALGHSGELHVVRLRYRLLNVTPDWRVMAGNGGNAGTAGCAGSAQSLTFGARKRGCNRTYAAVPSKALQPLPPLDSSLGQLAIPPPSAARNAGHTAQVGMDDDGGAESQDGEARTKQSCHSMAENADMISSASSGDQVMERWRAHLDALRPSTDNNGDTFAGNAAVPEGQTDEKDDLFLGTPRATTTTCEAMGVRDESLGGVFPNLTNSMLGVIGGSASPAQSLSARAVCGGSVQGSLATDPPAVFQDSLMADDNALDIHALGRSLGGHDSRGSAGTGAPCALLDAHNSLTFSSLFRSLPSAEERAFGEGPK